MGQPQAPIDLSNAADGPLLAAALATPSARRLLPYLYLESKRRGEPLRNDCARELRRHYAASLRRNLFLHSELVRLLAAFNRRDVDILPLKGTLLSLRLYRDLARPTSDIDLLVRPRHFDAAAKVLVDAGYRNGDDAGRYDVIFTRHAGAGPLGVELHRSFDHFTRCAQTLVGGAWSRATAIHDRDVGRFWRMEPTDELIYLCLNLCRHRFEDAFLALDVHLAVNLWHQEIDWNELARRCGRHRLRYPVALALAFARHWFRTEIPQRVLAELSPPQWKQALFQWAEWRGNVRRLEDWVPLGKHVEIALRMLLLDEIWQDRSEHFTFAIRACRRIATSRSRRLPVPNGTKG